jgi:hypothetical protein
VDSVVSVLAISYATTAIRTASPYSIGALNMTTGA